MNRYANAFTEASVILEYLDEDDYEKIPGDLMAVIKENRNEEYEYQLNEDLDLKNQPMLPETKALLFNIFRDYLSTTEQREKIIRMQREDLIKIKQKKIEAFKNSMNGNTSFQFDANYFETTREKTLDMIEYEEISIWKKLLNKMFGKFKKK